MENWWLKNKNKNNKYDKLTEQNIYSIQLAE